MSEPLPPDRSGKNLFDRTLADRRWSGAVMPAARDVATSITAHQSPRIDRFSSITARGWPLVHRGLIGRAARGGRKVLLHCTINRRDVDAMRA